jgi:beta-lactamase superfamily II metal-dependent hydrolase
MWNLMTICILLFNWGIFQPELPHDVEKINLNLSKDEIAFTFFDLSQGESTLIQSSTGDNILLNTGGPEAGEELLYYLDIYGVDELKTVIVTSETDEYIGNLQSVVKNVQVHNIVLPDASMDSPLQMKNVTWAEGDMTQLFEGLNCELLSKGNKDDHFTMDILLEYKGTNILYMTSAMEKVENKLMEKKDLSVVNILKVGDFGNPSGTTEAFLEECDPQVAIVFYKDDQKGITDVLERLHETWMDIYQTRQVGNISVKAKDHDYQVFTITLDAYRSMS